MQEHCIVFLRDQGCANSLDRPSPTIDSHSLLSTTYVGEVITLDKFDESRSTKWSPVMDHFDYDRTSISSCSPALDKGPIDTLEVVE